MRVMIQDVMFREGAKKMAGKVEKISNTRPLLLVRKSLFTPAIDTIREMIPKTLMTIDLATILIRGGVC